MLICPKCGSVAERDTAGNIVCTSQSCNWSDYTSNKTNKTQNDFIQSKKVDNVEKGINEISCNSYSNPILQWYYVEFIGEDSKLYQANCLYDLIEKMLKQEGEFTSFVEKCYRAFTKSSVSELIQFHNHFGVDIIFKISEFDNLNVIYTKE